MNGVARAYESTKMHQYSLELFDLISMFFFQQNNRESGKYNLLKVILFLTTYFISILLEN